MSQTDVTSPHVRALRKSTLTLDGGVACLEMTDVASRNAMSSGLKDDLEELIEFFNAECAAGGFPAGPLNEARIEAVRAAIMAIESATDAPPLRALSGPVLEE